MNIFLKGYDTNMKLIADNITKSYNHEILIQRVNINLDEGEIVGLLGVSGVGKTTMFNILSGLISPDSGKVIFENKNVTGRPGIVSYMLQKDQLFEFKTIIDNVSLPLIIKGMKKKEARNLAQSYFERFGILGYENSYPKELSGGMRQRAALLRTYLFSNEVMLLDEPFSALDIVTKTKMYSWFLDINKEVKVSTIFITHDIDEAIILSDRIYVMSGRPGKIVKEINLLDKPDNVIDFTLEQKFINYKKEILNDLKK